MVFSININKSARNPFAGTNGKLKPVNGVNGSPISIAPGFPDVEDKFNQMGIKYIRLHDTLGIADLDDYCQANRTTAANQLLPNVPANLQSKCNPFCAEFMNKRTLFPYAAAGMRSNNVDLAFKNANYQMTDYYIKRIMDNNPDVNPTNIEREVLFRIGRSNWAGYEVPQNFDIYATLVSTLVNRYSLNYKQTGLPRKVSHWEIWNEPDLHFFWNNNKPQTFYEFYSKIARVIKAVDPSAKVGAAGVAYGYNPNGEYLDGLLNYCRNTNTPIDFLSWHYYGNTSADPQNIIDLGNQIQTTLNAYGYDDLESLCTEWNSTPFASANTYTKVQSANNAAYIASTLMYMQYCKVDKAYYYRGDASSFGLFNDNDNTKSKYPSAKSFCSYAAQSFGLFSKMLEDTPYILGQDNTFNSGITTLAAENESGNKLNILAANFKVDYAFVDEKSPPTDTALYTQHYIDTNRSVNQLNDDWSKEHWFGGVDPNTVTYDNTVTQNAVVTATNPNGTITSRMRDYTLSNAGLQLNINNISSSYKGYTLTAYRITEGGRVDRLTPDDVTSSITVSMSNGTITIKDTAAKLSTVTLYSIELK